jgi:hypothetical protein
MQQQLELMNMKFGEVRNEMGELIIKVASLWDGSGRRGPESRRLVRLVISPPEESIAKKKNIDDEFEDFDHDYNARFQQHKNHKYKGVRPHGHFYQREQIERVVFFYDLDKNFESIKMKILTFQEKKILKHTWNERRKWSYSFIVTYTLRKIK